MSLHVGDLRPSNIILGAEENGSYTIRSIVDWEMSGFYPENFECTKITNNLAVDETSDRFLFLPGCVCPERYLSRWLADCVWDKQVVR